MLWDYCEEIRSTNPELTLKMLCDSRIKHYIKFQRLYVCLDAWKKGFMSDCRPVIGFDGCLVKGHQKSQLLTTVGTDPDNGIYPLAWAVVKAENQDTKYGEYDMDL